MRNFHKERSTGKVARYLTKAIEWYKELCVRSRYQGQGQVITSHTDPVGCNYVSLPLIPEHGTQDLIIHVPTNTRYLIIIHHSIGHRRRFWCVDNGMYMPMNRTFYIAYFTKDVNPSLSKPPWKFNSGLATLIARRMGPTWGPPGADRTQVGLMLAP